MNQETIPAERTKTKTIKEQTADVTNKQKGNNGKKYAVAGGIFVILLAVITGFSIYNMPANRLARQLDLGQRYLEELNYEQAIVAFDGAIAIDPMSVDAYLGKAEAYIALDDLQAAVETLQAGYDLTGDERLKAKLDELNYIELPFKLTDITIKGYDLFGDHYEEVCAAYGVPMDADVSSAGSGTIETVYGEISSYVIDEEERHSKEVCIVQSWQPEVILEGGWYKVSDSSVSYRIEPECNFIICSKGEMSLDLSALAINIPVNLSDSYEEWCQVMQISEIKKAAEEKFPNGGSKWEFYTEWGKGVYMETMDEEEKSCWFYLYDWSDHDLFKISIHMKEDLSIWLLNIEVYPGSF